MMSLISSTMHKETLELIGVEVVNFYGYQFITYYILLVIMGINTYKVMADYNNSRKGEKYNKNYTKFDLYSSILIKAIEFVSMFLVYSFTEYYTSIYLNQLLAISTVSLILLFIQYFIYVKINDVKY